jgi:hypothetical protein
VQELNIKSLEDIFMWCDGTWCYREEYLKGDYNHMSDDFSVISVYSHVHEDIVNEVYKEVM